MHDFRTIRYAHFEPLELPQIMTAVEQRDCYFRLSGLLRHLVVCMCSIARNVLAIPQRTDRHIRLHVSEIRIRVTMV